jgi:hypothetical protein
MGNEKRLTPKDEPFHWREPEPAEAGVSETRT